MNPNINATTTTIASTIAKYRQNTNTNNNGINSDVFRVNIGYIGTDLNRLENQSDIDEEEITKSLSELMDGIQKATDAKDRKSDIFGDGTTKAEENLFLLKTAIEATPMHDTKIRDKLVTIVKTKLEELAKNNNSSYFRQTEAKEKKAIQNSRSTTHVGNNSQFSLYPYIKPIAKQTTQSTTSYKVKKKVSIPNIGTYTVDEKNPTPSTNNLCLVFSALKPEILKSKTEEAKNKASTQNSTATPTQQQIYKELRTIIFSQKNIKNVLTNMKAGGKEYKDILQQFKTLYDKDITKKDHTRIAELINNFSEDDVDTIVTEIAEIISRTISGEGNNESPQLDLVFAGGVIAQLNQAPIVCLKKDDKGKVTYNILNASGILTFSGAEPLDDCDFHRKKINDLGINIEADTSTVSKNSFKEQINAYSVTYSEKFDQLNENATIAEILDCITSKEATENRENRTKFTEEIKQIKNNEKTAFIYLNNIPDGENRESGHFEKMKQAVYPEKRVPQTSSPTDISNNNEVQPSATATTNANPQSSNDASSDNQPPSSNTTTSATTSSSSTNPQQGSSGENQENSNDASSNNQPVTSNNTTTSATTSSSSTNPQQDSSSILETTTSASINNATISTSTDTTTSSTPPQNSSSSSANQENSSEAPLNNQTAPSSNTTTSTSTDTSSNTTAQSSSNASSNSSSSKGANKTNFRQKFNNLRKKPRTYFYQKIHKKEVSLGATTTATTPPQSTTSADAIINTTYSNTSSQTLSIATTASGSSNQLATEDNISNNTASGTSQNLSPNNNSSNTPAPSISENGLYGANDNSNPLPISTPPTDPTTLKSADNNSHNVIGDLEKDNHSNSGEFFNVAEGEKKISQPAATLTTSKNNKKVQFTQENPEDGSTPRNNNTNKPKLKPDVSTHLSYRIKKAAIIPQRTTKEEEEHNSVMPKTVYNIIDDSTTATKNNSNKLRNKVESDNNVQQSSTTPELSLSATSDTITTSSVSSTSDQEVSNNNVQQLSTEPELSLSDTSDTITTSSVSSTSDQEVSSTSLVASGTDVATNAVNGEQSLNNGMSKNENENGIDKLKPRAHNPRQLVKNAIMFIFPSWGDLDLAVQHLSKQGLRLFRKFLEDANKRQPPATPQLTTSTTASTEHDDSKSTATSGNDSTANNENQPLTT